MSQTEPPSSTPITAEEPLGRAPGRGRLRGRRVLVVGAGTRPSPGPAAPFGNGRAIACLCAREGALVACADRDAASAGETLARIQKEEGGRGAVVVADGAEADACEEAVAGGGAGAGGPAGGVRKRG